MLSDRTNHARSIAVLLGLVLVVACSSSPGDGSADRPPNIIYILADDLGYGELGCYGQERIETPHIDALARTGMRFTNHYSGAPVCAPARCVLMTGKHAGHAHIRGNDEWRDRGEVWDFQAMFDDPNLEGQRPIPDEEVTVAELLKQGGYATGCFGKWGLGAPNTEGIPNKQGFDVFYGYNCQRQAHTFYPLHLWRNEERDLLDNALVPPHAGLEEGADPTDPSSYAKFRLKDYAPTLIHQEVLSFIKTQSDRPFFVYYPNIIPHLPLQAPAHWLQYYREKFGPEAPYLGDKGYFPNQYPRAAYAAMISYLDEQVGEIVQLLKDLDLYDHTIVMFSSDNGPTYTGGADTPYFDSAKPFKTEYGWGKGFTHEGGIRVPLIASWPGQIQAGTSTDHVSIFYDLLPTLCDVASIDPPADIDGISFLPTLLGEPQPKHDYLYWEFPAYKGQQAVRMGHWKGIRKNIFEGNMDIELYDLAVDQREQENVADQHQDIVRQIADIMTEAHTPASIERFKIKELGD